MEKKKIVLVRVDINKLISKLSNRQKFNLVAIDFIFKFTLTLYDDLLHPSEKYGNPLSWNKDINYRL